MAKQQMFLLGAGGHAKMVLESLASMNQYEIIGCLEPQPKFDRVLGFPVLTENTSTLERLLESKALAFVALGDNRQREKLTEHLRSLGFDFATIISTSAYVSASATIEPGTVIMPKAVVGAETRIGPGVIINTASSVDHDGIIEGFVHVAPGCHLAGKVKVQQGAMLGIGTCVIPERCIGAWSILGANSTVVRDIPPGTTYVGTPARAASIPTPKPSET